jgi:prevent-host-death family protein
MTPAGRPPAASWGTRATPWPAATRASTAVRLPLLPASPSATSAAAKCTLCSMPDPYSLTEARAHLGELVARAKHTHRPVPITEHGKPTVAIVNIDDLADLEDRAALAAHYADKLAGRDGIRLADLDAALDRIDADDGR